MQTVRATASHANDAAMIAGRFARCIARSSRDAVQPFVLEGPLPALRVSEIDSEPHRLCRANPRPGPVVASTTASGPARAMRSKQATRALRRARGDLFDGPSETMLRH